MAEYNTPLKKKWTYSDYANTPEGFYFEIIGGMACEPPSPSYNHQRKSMDLGFEMNKFVREKKIGEILLAPLDVILDKENIVQPDIIFISNKRKGIIQEKGIFGSPDLLVEILSPSSINKDRVKKMELYKKFKVKEYWIVDTINKSMEVYGLTYKGYSLISSASGKGNITSKALAGFDIDIRYIFH